MSVIQQRDPGDENDATACETCDGATHDVRMRADTGGYRCDRCYENWLDREPGDSYYEDHGTVRHELQDAYGMWRR